MDDDATPQQIQESARSERLRITQHIQMAYALSQELLKMKCSIEGCPGSYEKREIIHTVRRHGQVIVIDGVPAEACTVCGDVLLKPATVRQIEGLLHALPQPARMVPLFESA